ncbi:unnamed protein product [Nyctereutes procyonoides]|uniref:(raccoon dog) hypothetical protein n=1 Tax=Nyctereutes procyonoides TaxID=34880 RepID=A0A811Z796_NYCPR|nr:unnamed protein product [Nyctereutes procyonoides]
MLAVESKTRYVVVRPLIPCPDEEESPTPSATPEEDRHLPLERLASTPEQHPEPPQEPAPAPTAGPAEAPGPDLFEAGTAPVHVVVTPLIHCPDLEEPPALLATPEGGAGPGACSRVRQRAGAATCLSGATSHGPEQQLVMAAAQRKASPPLSLCCFCILCFSQTSIIAS